MYGPHSPRTERHRQNRRNHGKRRQYGGVAYLIYRFDRDGAQASSAVRGHAEMSDDLFDDDNRIVYQYANGKNERE